MIPIAVGLGVAAVGWLLVLGRPVHVDEAWALQVVRRVRSGDVLYRDVFYGAAPLPVWIGRAAVRVGGDTLLSLRGLEVGLTALLAAAAVWVVDLVGAGAAAGALAVVSVIVVTGPGWGLDNLYGLAARVATVGVLGAVLAGAPSSLAWSVAAGALVGVALGTKQNLGAVLGVGTLVSVASGGELAPVLAVAVGAGLAVGLILAPVARQRALGDLVTRLGRNKRTYLSTGRYSPWRAVRGRLHAARTAGPLPPRLAALVTALAYVALPLAGVALIVAVAQSLLDERPASVAAAVATTAAVALASAVPRATPLHVQGLLPLAVLAAVAVAPTGVGLAALVVAGGVLTMLAGVVLATGRRRFPELVGAGRGVPGFGRLPVPADDRGIVPGPDDGLRDRTDGEVLLLRPDAAVWYVATGLANPTPFDYPLASVFGPGGEQAVVDAIDDGRIRWVCLPGRTAGQLRPVLLEDHVLGELEAVASTSAGRLYRSSAPDR